MRLSLSLGAMLTLSTAFMPPAVLATIISVDTTVDDTTVNGNCTLREAIIAANTDSAQDACPAGSGTDTIQVPAGRYVLTLTGTGEDAAATGDLDVTDSVSIVGNGDVVVDGNGTDRVFDIDPAATGITVTLVNLGIVNGGAVAQGGGIRNAGTLILQNGGVSLNVATIAGGAPAEGGGIYNSGDLQLVRNTVSQNSALQTSNQTATVQASGGGIKSTGTLTMTESTVSGNTVNAEDADGGGINATTVSLTRSTVVGNVSSPARNLCTYCEHAFGGGISVSAGATLINSTVAGNSGIANGIEARGGTLTFSNSTIFGAVQVTANAATFVFQNTIVDGCGVLGGQGFTTIADDYNLDISDTCGMSGTDLRGVDPLPMVPGPLPGSPAIDAGNPAVPGSGGGACEAVDQNGTPRPIGPRCDIGAHEAPLECPPTPRSGCASPLVRGAKVQFTKTANDAADRFSWRWRSNGPLAVSDFGNANTNLILCAYDQNGLQVKAALLGCAELPGSVSGCLGVSAALHNRILIPQGISLLRITPGTGIRGHGRFTEKGAGPNLHLPALPFAPPLRLQLDRDDSSACWEATFSTPAANTTNKFSATSD